MLNLVNIINIIHVYLVTDVILLCDSSELS